jgi:hypothetical protein
MKRHAIVLSLLALIGVGASGVAPPRITGIYSNLGYNQGGGDLLGMELMVIPGGGGGYTVFVQIAQGGAPETAITTLAVDGNKIAFEMPEDGAYPGQRLAGTLTATGMRLKWSSGDVEVLKRGKSYWQ